MSNKENGKNSEITFEEAMKQLENIANELENGKLTLDESVNKFEEGMKLSKKCNDILDNADKRITIITTDNGKMKEEDFKPSEE